MHADKIPENMDNNKGAKQHKLFSLFPSIRSE